MRAPAFLDALGSPEAVEVLPKGEVSTSPLPLPVEFFDEVRPQFEGRTLVKGLLLAGSVSVIFGHPGSGKSFVALDLGLHIAAGRDWLGRKVQGGTVVFVAAEGQIGTRLRIEAWKNRYEFDGVQLPFALVPCTVDLFRPDADLHRLSAALELVASQCGEITLLVIDTLAATMGAGDENGPDMAAYVRNIQRLRDRNGCTSMATMIVHHQPVTGDARRPRGHSSLWGAADTVLHVDSSNGARRLQSIKQKDLELGDTIVFTLRSVAIGRDEYGDEVTSCVVEGTEAGEPSDRPQPKLSAKEQIALGQLDQVLTSQGREPPPEFEHELLDRSRTKLVASMSEWRTVAVSALRSPDTKPDTARTAFLRAANNLERLGLIAKSEEIVWRL